MVYEPYNMDHVLWFIYHVLWSVYHVHGPPCTLIVEVVGGERPRGFWGIWGSLRPLQGSRSLIFSAADFGIGILDLPYLVTNLLAYPLSIVWNYLQSYLKMLKMVVGGQV